MPTTSATLSRRVQLGAIVEYRAAVARRRRSRGCCGGSTDRPTVRGIVIGARLADAARRAHDANTDDGGDLCGVRRPGLRAADLQSGAVGGAAPPLPARLLRDGRGAARLCAVVVGRAGLGVSRRSTTTTASASTTSCSAWPRPARSLFARSFFEPRVFAGWLGARPPWRSSTLAASGLIFAAVSHIDMSRRRSRCASMHVPDRAAGRRRRSCGSAWRARQPLSVAVRDRLGRADPVCGRAHPVGAARDSGRASGSTIRPCCRWRSRRCCRAWRSPTASRCSAASATRRWPAKSRARLLADADPLTGLLNRRAFLEQAIGRPGAQTLHLIDIDHFKAVNDTLGHDGGDEVLRVFARTLRAAVPRRRR